MQRVHCFVMEKYCLARRRSLCRDRVSAAAFAAAAGNATAPGNIMHNGFWSIDIYGIGLVCPTLPPCDDLGSDVRQLKFVMGKVKVELLVGVT